jgi:SAM-dependent methyltransferase
LTPWPRPLVAGLDLLNRRGKAAAVRLVRCTGKSPHFIHPKHLVDTPGHDWYAAHLGPGDVVLDVGCANGAHTLKAAPRVTRVVGMDYDVGQLGVAAASARRRGLDNVRLFAWDLARPFPFPDATFDAALCLDVIEHLHGRQALLREIRRALKPGGRLLISGPNRESRWRERLRAAGLFAFQDEDHKVEYTSDEFLAELESAGFVVEGALEPVVYDTPLAGLIDAIGGISLAAYARLARWKRRRALEDPRESTGFRAVCRKRT